MRNLLLAGLAAIALFPAPASARPRCGTPERIATFRPVPARAPSIALAGGEKLDRDPFPVVHEVRTSANFAVRWRLATVTEDQARMVLDELERSWAVYIDELGQTPPFGTDTYRLNLYISQADDIPAIDFGGGYAGQDDEGFPYIVLSKDLFAEGELWVRSTAAHELYHDFQITTGAFYNPSSNWWWEATAEWASQEMFPDEPLAYLFVGAYALIEELPMYFMGDPFGDDEIKGVRQYGASVFAKYMTETMGNRLLVPQTWEQSGPSDDALRALFGLVTDDPGVVADLFGEFAAHTALWDVPHGESIVPMVDAYAGAYPDRPRTDATVGPEGTDWTSVDAGHEVSAFGYNLIDLARPADGELRIEVRMPPATIPADWRVTLVRDTAAGPTYTPVPVAAGAGRATVSLAPDEPHAWLVVAAIADTRLPDRTFPYELRIGAVEPEPDPDPDPDPPGDAGCSTGGSPGGLVLIGIAAIVAWDRRRRRR